MTLPILNFEVHENLATHHIFFEKLKDFAVAQGWTCTLFNQSKQWAWDGSKYDWLAGNEDFFSLTSSGFGSQNIIVRARLRDTLSGDADFIDFGGHTSDTYAVMSGYNPYRQNNLGASWNNITYNFLSLKRTNIPIVWFFGNSKIIIFVMQCAPDYVQTFCFGTYNLYNSSDTQHLWLASNANNQPWTNKDGLCCFDGNSGYGTYYRDLERSCPRSFLWGSSNTIGTVLYAPHYRAMTKNVYFERRPIFEQVAFSLNADGTMKPVGTLWAGRLNTHGLNIGERVKYGSEEYLTFPFSKIDWYTGFAIRIV